MNGRTQQDRKWQQDGWHSLARNGTGCWSYHEKIGYRLMVGEVCSLMAVMASGADLQEAVMLVGDLDGSKEAWLTRTCMVGSIFHINAVNAPMNLEGVLLA